VATATLTRPEQTPVERYFDLALYLLIVTGFLCLAGTGKVDLLSLLVAGAAFGYRGYLLARREVLTLSELWTTGFTIFYFVFTSQTSSSSHGRSRSRVCTWCCSRWR